MSAKSRYKNHRSAAPSTNAIINKSINTANTIAQQLSTASPFEADQLQHLQIMIEHLARQVMLSMKQTEEMQTKENQPKTTITLLRVYAQYLNLYMKFKNNYFSASESQPIIHTQHSANPSAKPSGSPIIHKTNTQSQLASLSKPVSDRHHPSEDKRTRQIQESIQRVIHKNEPNPLLPQSAVNGFLIPS